MENIYSRKLCLKLPKTWVFHSQSTNPILLMRIYHKLGVLWAQGLHMPLKFLWRSSTWCYYFVCRVECSQSYTFFLHVIDWHGWAGWYFGCDLDPHLEDSQSGALACISQISTSIGGLLFDVRRLLDSSGYIPFVKMTNFLCRIPKSSPKTIPTCLEPSTLTFFCSGRTLWSILHWPLSPFMRFCRGGGVAHCWQWSAMFYICECVLLYYFTW